jgi:hypothetical protein
MERDDIDVRLFDYEERETLPIDWSYKIDEIERFLMKVRQKEDA